jgi:hypothetical protein
MSAPVQGSERWFIERRIKRLAGTIKSLPSLYDVENSNTYFPVQDAVKAISDATASMVALRASLELAQSLLMLRLDELEWCEAPDQERVA